MASIKRRLLQTATEAFFKIMPSSQARRIEDELQRMLIRSQEIQRQYQASQAGELDVEIRDHQGRQLGVSVLEASAPWSTLQPPETDIPGMLTLAEQQYYGYITQFYRSTGSIVEIGPWMGLSTLLIARGLMENPHFRDTPNARLNVFDDFVWRSSWMDKWFEKENLALPANHESFQSLFEGYTKEVADRLHVQRRKVVDYDGNESLPAIEWTDGPIEIIIVDCGRTLEVNDAWWNTFEPSFVPDQTLVIMQDWQNHKN
ncbi:MAG: hypothetical protein AAFP90_14695, partial [Planctomycetota bacterium]